MRLRMTNIVVPRPIAWVTSLDSAGLVNLAPFSFFNAAGSDPLYLVLSIGRRLPPDLSEATAAGLQTAPSVYCRTTDRFEVPRISYAEWRKNQR